jgi:hypothetical protein
MNRCQLLRPHRRSQSLHRPSTDPLLSGLPDPTKATQGRDATITEFSRGPAIRREAAAQLLE